MQSKKAVTNERGLVARYCLPALSTLMSASQVHPLMGCCVLHGRATTITTLPDGVVAMIASHLQGNDKARACQFVHQ